MLCYYFVMLLFRYVIILLCYYFVMLLFCYVIILLLLTYYALNEN